jgi:hypothetical protein
MSKQTAVDYLVKELSAILGRLETNTMQDLLMADAINKAKQMEKEQLISFGYTQIQYKKMSKILIPQGADCFCTNYGKLNYHVAIEKDDEFKEFCSRNNIGYHDGARKDIIKSAGHIFTENKDVFENFPSKVELMS